MAIVLVTGATGTVGSLVLKDLLLRPGLEVRAGVRRSAALPGGAIPVELDFDRPETVDAAMRGVDRLFLLTPVDPRQVHQAKLAVDAARRAGVRQVVRLSIFGADHRPSVHLGRWHREVELHLEASGLGWTFLRPNAFMQNFIAYTPPGPDGAIRAPLGNGALSLIDARDVAAVAAAVLASERHAGKIYTLTGPEALNLHQVAAAIGAASGREIRYVDVPEAEARRAMLDAGTPEPMVNALLELQALEREGWLAGVTQAVERVIGRRPRGIAEFARDHASAWAAR